MRLAFFCVDFFHHRAFEIALGTQWERVSEVVGPVSAPVLIGLAVIAAAALAWWLVRRRRPHDAQDRPAART